MESMPSNRTELKALKQLIFEVDLMLESTPEFPQDRTGRSRELLRAAIALADDLIEQSRMTPTAAMGHKGGSVTAQRGSEHFRQLAARRKTKVGGRPRSSW